MALSIATLAIIFSWTGYIASDDELYISTAISWLTDFPHMSQHFGGIRHGLVLPLALAAKLGGTNFAAMIVPVLAFYYLTIVVTYVAVCRFFGRKSALIAAILLGIVPLFPSTASMIGVDLAIVFYASTSFWLFQFSKEKTRRWRGALFLSGALAGVAVLSRETAGILLLLYFGSFALGQFREREQFLLLFSGFFVVFLADMAFFGVVGGTPFHRFEMLLVGSSIEGFHAAKTFGISADGNVRLSPIFDPLIKMFVPKDYNFLFWLFVPAAFWVWNTKHLSPKEKRLAITCVVASIVWFVLISIALHSVSLHARYYLMPSYFAIIATAIFVGRAEFFGRLKIQLPLWGLLTSVSVANIYVLNTDVRFAEKTLVSWVRDNQIAIKTDPRTAHRLPRYLEWSGVPLQMVQAGVPQKGDYYFYNPNSFEIPSQIRFDGNEANYQPQKHWVLVTQIESPVREIKSLLDSSGITQYLPEILYRKLVKPNYDVFVYRIPWREDTN